METACHHRGNRGDKFNSALKHLAVQEDSMTQEHIQLKFRPFVF